MKKHISKITVNIATTIASYLFAASLALAEALLSDKGLSIRDAALFALIAISGHGINRAKNGQLFKGGS
jgi:hypothetical protein